MPTQRKKTKNEGLIDQLPIILSLLVIILYIFLAANYIHHIQPVMDESTYLLKGKWFIDGTYKPFQDYGPLTNKPPLAFLSLGISQIIFSPGLGSGRILAIFYSVVMLAGIWMTVRRLSSDWWAFFCISLCAISPAWIIYYSRAMTQVISSLLVVWSLYFLLGEKKKNWEPYAGVILAAVTTLIRQNMLPFFGLVILYILWTEGINKGWKPALAGILVFILSNVVYWPRIYTTIWEPQMPRIVNTFAHLFIAMQPIGELGLPALNKDFLLLDEIQVLFDAFRYFFLPIITTIATFLMVPLTTLFKNKKYRNLAFLAVTFAGMTAIHFLASTSQNNFLYSFPAYLAFYLPVGIILIPVLINAMSGQHMKKTSLIFAGIVIMIMAGIGLSLRQEIAPLLMKLRVPSSTSLFHGRYELWDILLTRFGIPVSQQDYLLPVAAGAMFGLMTLAVAGIAWMVLRKKEKPIHYFDALFFILLFLGLILSPSRVLAGQGSIGVCKNDVLERNERIGERLQSALTPGALVYWEGIIPTPLLYLTDYRIFPVQLNMQFNYLVGGNPDFLERNGYWNDELAQRWIKEADYLLLSPGVAESRQIQTDLGYQGMFFLQEETESVNPCSDSTILLIFKKTN